jgi:hypothetical protein
MVSLWGSKNDDQQAADEPENGRTSHDTDGHEPTETTRLIQQRPPPPHSDGYLDPDDPAVSTTMR